RCRKPTHEPPICARSVPKAALARPLPTRQTRQKGRLNFLYPILLIGIAVKNSILLVDYAVMAEEKGMTRHEALMDACHKRARPVIMTTLAMGAGMMPIALGLTADSSFRMPMAVAVIGGLITSTVLSLVVVPAAYTLVDDLEERVLGKLRRKAADASEVAAPP
ncbi:efflux RND transporter permease subunit, partial [Pseudoxanthomonas sp.]|uniref:efflux RND transporter permease subunit n=2 Tax=Pseudomonadota TaxID=1224 RepID=UPI0025FAA236